MTERSTSPTPTITGSGASIRHRIITTILGTGVAGIGADGVAGTRSQVKNPKSVALYGGALYVADLSDRVRRLDLSTGIVTTVAGTGTPATPATGAPRWLRV